MVHRCRQTSVPGRHRLLAVCRRDHRFRRPLYLLEHFTLSCGSWCRSPVSREVAKSAKGTCQYSHQPLALPRAIDDPSR